MNRNVARAIDIVQRLPERARNAVILNAILVHFLWEVLDMFEFGGSVIIEWLSLVLHSPESQVGVGLGGAVSAAVGIKYDWPWGVVIVGIFVGALLGGCFFSGIYKLLFRHH